MPVSKRNPKRKGITKRIATNAGLDAGAKGAMRALDSMLDGSVGNDDLVALQGFFWGYTLAVTRAGHEPACDVPWINRMLNKIEYNMPVSGGEIYQLRQYATALLAQSKKVRSMKVWMSALNDMEVYATLNNWRWAGIGERTARSEVNA